MRGEAYSAEAFRKRGSLVNGYRGGVGEQVFVGSDYFIVFIHNKLLAENIGAVFYWYSS